MTIIQKFKIKFNKINKTNLYFVLQNILARKKTIIIFYYIST